MKAHAPNKRLGRPVIPKEQRKVTTGITLSPALLASIRASAARDGVSVSHWIARKISRKQVSR